MLVSYLPCITPLLLIGVPLLFLLRNRRAAKVAALGSASVLGLLVLVVYVPGWW
jgi:hypothetical protein